MSEIKDRMQKAVEALERELQTIRTGRANPAILDRVQADYYGAPSPLKNMANISIIDGRTLEVKPFDKTLLKDLEKAIQDSDLGLTPTNDGNRLIINIPQPTQERRKELGALVKKEAEKAKVAVRNIRRDEMEKIKKSDQGSEDEKKKEQEEVQKTTDEFIKLIDNVSSEKEKEVMTI